MKIIITASVIIILVYLISKLALKIMNANYQCGIPDDDDIKP
jgi:hypothetical protein